MSQLYHPVDGIQCIVQKMRIDLCLQHFVLRILQNQLPLIILIDQLLDSAKKVMKLLRELSDFVLTLFCLHLIYKLQITIFCELHPLNQNLDRLRDIP